MLDREKVVAVLKRRFPGSDEGQVAAAANAIVGLDDDWVELRLPYELWPSYCRQSCWLQHASAAGELRVFRRAHDGWGGAS
jgi:hypothetical protein